MLKLKKVKHIVAIAIALIMCCNGTLVFANTEPDIQQIVGSTYLFCDVTPESEYYEAIEYIANLGYITGAGDGSFKPDSDITIRQLSLMMCRYFGLHDLIEQEATTDGIKYGDYCGAWLYKKNIIPMEAVIDLDQKLYRGSFYTIMFKCMGIPTYKESTLHLTNEFSITWEDAVDIGIELGLCDEGTSYKDIITRGEATYTLYWILTHEYEVQSYIIKANQTVVNEDNFKIINTDGVSLVNYYRALSKIPSAIINEFNNRCWRFYIKESRIDAFKTERNSNENYVGLCSYSEQAIYVIQSGAVIHEFGHFLDYIDNWPSNRLWSEHENARFLKDYAMTDAKEYFADYFAFYITNSKYEDAVEMMKEQTPKTYEYFKTLEDLDWDCKLN